MSTTVSYKGHTLTTVSNDTKTLLTEGKYLEDDLTLVDVSGGGSTLITKSISANGTYNASSDSADGYSQVNVAVPNTYTNADEGKVVSDGALVAQTSKNINSNGTHSTVTNNQVVVAVPNSYSAGDEGKVVSNGALVAQTSDTVTTNDTYDTTLINSLTVNVSGGGGADLSPIAASKTLNQLSGLFDALDNDTGWGYVEYSCTSGTANCVVDFGRAIKGLIIYPKSTSFADLANNERQVLGAVVFNDPDEDGIQSPIWQVYRIKNNAKADSYINRTSSRTLQNGVLTAPYNYSSNNSYHPFGFGIPYLFVYWW